MFQPERPYQLRGPDRWALGIITLVLAGYAFLGRGFAYVGVPPLFVGEIALAVGLAAVLFGDRLWRALKPAAARGLVLFMLLGFGRLMVDVGEYGVDAMRDSVIWGYGLFTFVVAGLLMRDRERLRIAIRRYRKFVAPFLLSAGALYLFARTQGLGMPHLPGSPAPIIEAKGGDMMVHLAGATAFLMVGLARRRWWLFLALGIDLAVLGITSRAGMVAYLAATTLVIVLRSRRVRLGLAVYAAMLIISVFVVIDPRIELPGGRDVSIDQFTENFRSMGGSSDKSALENTKAWRLNWWSKIIEYTFTGPYFLTGKGFGINLADDDGFQVTKNSNLRSPHNGHLSILARMGVPGLLLWLFVQGAWLAGCIRGMLSARTFGEDGWHGLFLFLIAYWTAFMMNASFDVYIEGPMGGIWYWCVMGLGLAAVEIYGDFERQRGVHAAPAAGRRAVAHDRAGSIPSGRPVLPKTGVAP